MALVSASPVLVYDQAVRFRPKRRSAMPRVFWTWLLLWLGAAAWAPLPALARHHKKPPEEQPQPPPRAVDPMEVENSTSPPQQQPQQQPPPGHSSNDNANQALPQPPQPTNEKVGRFMANLKIGPALCLYTCGHSGAMVLELGFSILPNKNAYLVFPLQFQFAPSGAAIMVPLGFQYDIAMPFLSGLYLYPRFSIGYAYLIDSASPGSPTAHGGFIIPEFGIKYVWRGRWNFGGELVSIPILFGQTQFGSFANIFYRILLSAGVNF